MRSVVAPQRRSAAQKRAEAAKPRRRAGEISRHTAPESPGYSHPTRHNSATIRLKAAKTRRAKSNAPAAGGRSRALVPPFAAAAAAIASESWRARSRRAALSRATGPLNARAAKLLSAPAGEWGARGHIRRVVARSGFAAA
jgi:hypothetical protein